MAHSKLNFPQDRFHPFFSLKRSFHSENSHFSGTRKVIISLKPVFVVLNTPLFRLSLLRCPLHHQFVAFQLSNSSIFGIRQEHRTVFPLCIISNEIGKTMRCPVFCLYNMNPKCLWHFFYLCASCVKSACTAHTKKKKGGLCHAVSSNLL